MGNDSWVRRSYCIPIVVVFIVINVAAFLGAARMRFTFFELPGEKSHAAVGRSPAGSSSRSSSAFRTSPYATGESTQISSSVCAMISIGDDTGEVDPTALPFPRLYRLFGTTKEEILRMSSKFGKSNFPKSDRSTTNRTKNSHASLGFGTKNRTTPVKVFVGVDYGSLACKMARDALQEDFKDEFPGLEVDLSCGTVDYANKWFVNLEGGNNSKPNLPISKVACGTVVIGRSTQYVPQINVPLCEIVSWKRLRAVDLDEADVSRQAPAIPRSEWRPTVVTAFSSNHFPVALLLLRSLGKAGREAALAGFYNISIVVYTLEKFNPRQQGILDCLVHELNEQYGIPTEVRQFDFLAHPSWMRINQTNGYEKGGTGEYAWKAIILHTVLVERGFVLWTDAGSRFDMEGLKMTLDHTQRYGFASSHSYGQVPKLVHPGQTKYLRYQVRSGRSAVQNCDASRIAFTLDRYESLARPWYDCSLTRQCIAPDGSDRKNHRQDQAALTLLADMSDSKCEGVPDIVSHHMDYWPSDFSKTFPTPCYEDPLEVEISA